MDSQRALAEAAGPTPELVQAELDAILASPSFQQAPRASRLIRFLVTQTLAGAGDGLKEYVVGVEVFDKGASFDPRSDSSVRVEAARLRTRLREYYDTEGHGHTLRIGVPKGGYTAVFELKAIQPPASPRTPLRLGKPWPLLAAGAVASVLGVVLILRLLQPGSHSLAVLPLINLNGDAGTESFADGFVDELTTVLGQTPELQVVARTSAFQFKDKREDARSIARSLRVRTLLEGSVRRSDGRLHLTAQLIDGRDGFHLWSRTFDRPLNQAVAVQEEIAREVRAALHVSEAPPRFRPSTPEVQALYWQGLYLRSRRDVESLRSGVECLEKAAALDPSFAPAHGALALIHAARGFHRLRNRGVEVDKAKVLAAKALAADEGNPDGHLTLAWVRFSYDWNWASAETEFRRALALRPSYAVAHNLYALGLATRARFDEAIRAATRARELDPLSYAVSNDLGVVLYCARRYAEARHHANQVLQIEPAFAPARSLIGLSLAAERQTTAAEKEYRTLLRQQADNLEIVARLAALQARTGQRDAALAALARLEREIESVGNPGFTKALIYSGLRDHDRGIAALEQACQQRESNVLFAAVDPAFDELRTDPRFSALLARYGVLP